MLLPPNPFHRSRCLSQQDSKGKKQSNRQPPRCACFFLPPSPPPFLVPQVLHRRIGAMGGRRVGGGVVGGRRYRHPAGRHGQDEGHDQEVKRATHSDLCSSSSQDFGVLFLSSPAGSILVCRRMSAGDENSRAPKTSAPFHPHFIGAEQIPVPNRSCCRSLVRPRGFFRIFVFFASPTPSRCDNERGVCNWPARRFTLRSCREGGPVVRPARKLDASSCCGAIHLLPWNSPKP